MLKILLLIQPETLIWVGRWKV